MKYSSLSKKIMLAAVVALASQPLVVAMDSSAPLTNNSSVFTQAAYGIGKVTTSSLYCFKDVGMLILRGIAGKVAEKSDLLAENHPIVCAALVVGGCYGIYSLWNNIICPSVKKPNDNNNR